MAGFWPMMILAKIYEALIFCFFCIKTKERESGRRIVLPWFFGPFVPRQKDTNSAGFKVPGLAKIYKALSRQPWI